jgi:hypothetical protein
VEPEHELLGEEAGEECLERCERLVGIVAALDILSVYISDNTAEIVSVQVVDKVPVNYLNTHNDQGL